MTDTVNVDLTAVIGWLENGCAVEPAITELKIYQARLSAAQKADHVPDASNMIEAPKVEQEPCKGCGNTKPVGPEYISCCPDGPRHKPASASDELPSISLDGPHKPNDHRVWLARQLLDSKNDDATAYGIAAFHPAISDLWKKSKTFKSIKPEAPKVEPVAWEATFELTGQAVTLYCDPTGMEGWVDVTPLYTHPAPSSDELLEASDFLADRVADHGRSLEADDFYGHVLPALARYRLAKHKGPQS